MGSVGTLPVMEIPAVLGAELRRVLAGLSIDDAALAGAVRPQRPLAVRHPPVGGAARQQLEAHASDIGAQKLALGLHTTDLLAGLLNSYTTGFDLGGIPSRRVGPFTYVLPLAFVPKRELHLYYLHRTGHHPKQTEPNQWEFNPSDRNFFYYLADQMQWQFPGIETWMFTTHDGRVPGNQLFRSCENCGASVLEQPSGDHPWPGICDVCVVLDKHGWIDR